MMAGVVTAEKKSEDIAVVGDTHQPLPLADSGNFSWLTEDYLNRMQRIVCR